MIRRVLSLYHTRKLNKVLRNLQSVGDNVHIQKGFNIDSPNNVKIGSNVYVGPNNTWYGFGGITVGDGTIFAHNVEIMTRNHNYNSDDLESIPYDKTYVNKPVILKENVWVGSNVLIVPGITIGEGVVIGMGAVVTKDVPPYAVVGGNPARIIKYRNKEKYEKLKAENKVYLRMKFDK